MCGIAATFNCRSGAPIDRAELVAIRDAMIPRGPDGLGEWFSSDGRVGLGHRRLSIIDLSPAGAQLMRILFLVTDAFGGHGGIAKFNRDLLSALCADPSVSEVVALPRLMPDEPGNLPPKLRWVSFHA